MTITLPYPPSANRFWRNQRGRMVKSTEAKQYQEEVGWITKLKGIATLTGDVAVTIRLYRPQKSGDLDNRIKPLLDSLIGISYVDDKQIVEIHAYRHDDKNNPRVEIEVVEV